jgi:hypothetical protein
VFFFERIFVFGCPPEATSLYLCLRCFGSSARGSWWFPGVNDAKAGLVTALASILERYAARDALRAF